MCSSLPAAALAPGGTGTCCCQLARSAVAWGLEEVSSLTVTVG
jgi:hypothetical protein